jgi:hypothetical protein
MQQMTQLARYVKVYFELMLELDHVCQFVMGLPTWAKRKLEENWPSSLFEAIMKVESFSDVGKGENTSRNPLIYNWCLRLIFSRKRHFTIILLIVA